MYKRGDNRGLSVSQVRLNILGDLNKYKPAWYPLQVTKYVRIAGRSNHIRKSQ